MPYIKVENREVVDVYLKSILGHINDAGQLNYAITKLAAMYLKKKGLKYQNLNEVVGALQCAQLELYRRIADPYEDIKRYENTDVAEYKEFNEYFVGQSKLIIADIAKKQSQEK